jgi:cobalt-zinc-cadmium efflux system outer membrane protein
MRADREVINRLLGLWGSQTNWILAETLPDVRPDTSEDTNYEAVALRQRLDLEIARSQVDVARSSLGLKRSTRWLPAGVSVGVDTEREAPGDRLTGPTLELSLPIFNQGQAEVATLTAEFRRAEASLAALAIAIRSEVREARDRLIAAATMVQYFQTTLLPQRKAILRETLLHYNAMQKSSYELLAAKQQELLAERESIEALREYWIARVEFESALGGRLSPVKAESTSGAHEGHSPNP